MVLSNILLKYSHVSFISNSIKSQLSWAQFFQYLNCKNSSTENMSRYCKKHTEFDSPLHISLKQAEHERNCINQRAILYQWNVGFETDMLKSFYDTYNNNKICHLKTDSNIKPNNKQSRSLRHPAITNYWMIFLNDNNDFYNTADCETENTMSNGLEINAFTEKNNLIHFRILQWF